MNDENLNIPQSTEAEQAVLGSILLDNNLLNDISGILAPRDFHFEAHQHIFRAMHELLKSNQPIDEVLLSEELKSTGKLEGIGGIIYLAELVDLAPSQGNISFYAKIIKDHAVLRELITISSDIGIKSRDPEQNVSELLQEAQSKIAEIAEKTSKKSYRHIKEVLKDNFQRIEELSENKDEISGLKTGFIDIDKMMSGLQPADLIIVAARPSMGKTAFAVNVGSYIARTQPEKGAVLIFSIEMQDTQLGTRLLSGDANIDSKKFRTGNLDQEEWDNLAMSADRLSNIPLYINDSSKITPQEMVSETNKLNKELENGVSLVIVDYLQLAQGKGNPSHREQEIANITRSLKGLAKDLNIPVIALSQLNRSLESRSDKRPLMSDLRESGSIEQDADVIIMIYRDEVYDKKSDRKGIADFIFRKHRNGACGPVPLSFIAKYTKFGNLAKSDIPTQTSVKKKTKKRQYNYPNNK